MLIKHRETPPPPHITQLTDCAKPQISTVAGHGAYISHYKRKHEMSTNSYDSEPFGRRHFIPPPDVSSCFLSEIDGRKTKAETVQMEDGGLILFSVIKHQS